MCDLLEAQARQSAGSGELRHDAKSTDLAAGLAVAGFINADLQTTFNVPVDLALGNASFQTSAQLIYMSAANNLALGADVHPDAFPDLARFRHMLRLARSRTDATQKASKPSSSGEFAHAQQRREFFNWPRLSPCSGWKFKQWAGILLPIVKQAILLVIQQLSFLALLTISMVRRTCS